MTEPAGRHTDQATGDRYYVYPPTGELLDSVTTVIGATNSKPWIAKWHGSTSMAFAVDNLGLLAAVLAGEHLTAEQEIAAAAGRKCDPRTAAINLGKDEAERIRNLKADAGTYVHDVLERLILWAASPDGTGHQVALPIMPAHLEDALYDGEPLPDVTDFMVQGFMNFVADFKPEFLASEMAVYNQPLGVAGTLDLIARLHGYMIHRDGDRLTAGREAWVTPCIDVKTGKNPEGTWKEQLAAYRRMKQCLLPLGDIQPMPFTDCGAVLHLRPEYPDGYLLMLVAGADDEAAWERFQAAARIYRERQKVKDKPGKVVRALAADGTLPGPRICDLWGEGYGRALAPLARELGADAELAQLARFTEADFLAIKGIGPKLVGTIHQVLQEHGLAGTVSVP